MAESLYFLQQYYVVLVQEAAGRQNLQGAFFILLEQEKKNVIQFGRGSVQAIIIPMCV